MELRTKDAVTALDRVGIRNAATRATGSDVDQASEWELKSAELGLTFPDETGAPFRVSFVTIGQDRWIAVRETQAGDLTHVYLGLVPDESGPPGHISILRDAKRVLGPIRRAARGWRGFRFWRKVGTTADLHLNREASGIAARPPLSILKALVSDPVLKAALVLTPIVAVRLYRTTQVTAGVLAQEIGALLAILATIGVLQWVGDRRKTDWVVRGVEE